MSNKLLSAFALLAVANATDVYTARWSSDTCTGNPVDSAKVTLGTCTYDGIQYEKITYGGGEYTWKAYSDNSCYFQSGGTSVTTAGACLPYPGDAGTTPGAQVLSAAAYPSSVTNSYDCTSGTCSLVASNSACKCPSAPILHTY